MCVWKSPRRLVEAVVVLVGFVFIPLGLYNLYHLGKAAVRDRDKMLKATR